MYAIAGYLGVTLEAVGNMPEPEFYGWIAWLKMREKAEGIRQKGRATRA